MNLGIFPELHPWIVRVRSLLSRGAPRFNLGLFLKSQIDIFRAMDLDAKENSKSEPFVSKLSKLEVMGKVDQESFFDSCGANIAAGSDTTAISLSSLLWHVYRDPGVLRKLRDEIDHKEATGQLSDPVTFEESLDMPYLQAVIREALRMHPAVGQLLARSVPETGLYLEGYYFPPQVRANT